MYSFVEDPGAYSSKMLKVIVLFALLALSCALLVERASVDTDDEEVVAAANAAAKMFNKQFSGKYHHRLARVLKADVRDWLHGKAFKMDIVVGQTTCKKEEYKWEDIQDCDFRTGQSVFKKCTVDMLRDADGNHNIGAKGCILATRKEIEGLH